MELHNTSRQWIKFTSRRETKMPKLFLATHFINMEEETPKMFSKTTELRLVTKQWLPQSHQRSGKVNSAFSVLILMLILATHFINMEEDTSKMFRKTTELRLVRKQWLLQSHQRRSEVNSAFSALIPMLTFQKNKISKRWSCKRKGKTATSNEWTRQCLRRRSINGKSYHSLNTPTKAV